MNFITTSDLLEAAAFAAKSPEKYDQRVWCGTSCCILGIARERAGRPALNKGIQPDELAPDDSPRGRMVRTMLSWGYESTARLMPLVGLDGCIRVPAGAQIPGFGDGALIHAGAVIGDGALIHAGAVIGDGAVIGIEAVIHAEAVIGAGAVIGDGAVIDAP